MKIDLYSDLHVDMWKRAGQEVDLKKLIDPKADIAVFAGDAGNGWDIYESVVRDLKDIYGDQRVVSVPGNHDYYGKGRNWSMREDDKSCSITEIDGVRFAACTYWTNFREDFSSAAIASRSVRDWMSIPEFRDISAGDQHWLLPHTLNRLHKNFLKNAKADIVVTHFAPHENSIHESYKGNVVNPYFVNNDEALILELKPKLWLHGHVHNSFDYMVGDTRVVAKPFGYPRENYEDVYSLVPFTLEIT